jgi:transglutaminase-like putative cysteine protease
VWEHHVEVRLTPQHNAHQHVITAEVAIDPACEPHSYHDCFGNRVHYCSLIAPHDQLAVRGHAVVDTALDNPFDYPVVPPARERQWVAESLRAQPRLWDYVLHRSAQTPDLTTLTVPGLVVPAHQPEQPLLNAVMAALEWIGETIAHTPGFPPALTKLEEALGRRTGTCQDLAHLLISTVRAWGFPARYVMGYQDPENGADDEPVHDLHAWAEVLVPGAGWRGFDPTTQLVANQTYVAVAVGRDAGDALPIKTVFKGGDAAGAAAPETAVVVEVTRSVMGPQAPRIGLSLGLEPDQPYAIRYAISISLCMVISARFHRHLAAPVPRGVARPAHDVPRRRRAAGRGDCGHSRRRARGTVCLSSSGGMARAAGGDASARAARARRHHPGDEPARHRHPRALRAGVRRRSQPQFPG